MEFKVVAEQGTHLLIAHGERYAVIERRNDRFYNCHDDKRDGVPADNLSAVARILDEGDWAGKEAAQAAFEEVVSRGTGLAERML